MTTRTEPPQAPETPSPAEDTSAPTFTERHHALTTTLVVITLVALGVLSGSLVGKLLGLLITTVLDRLSTGG